MKIVKEKPSSSSDLSGSMTDICFLLIIFFLVAAVFINDEGFALFLPSKTSEPQKKTEEKLVNMKLLQEDTIRVNKKQYPIEQLSSVITSLIQVKSRENNVIPIGILEINDDISYKRAMDVISIIERAGIKNFTISSSGIDSFLIPINFSSDKGYVQTNLNTKEK